ncbi:hypothetical protein [Protofrankia symbiont of Coriaria ruscifolia]|uniref:hypothetical protein n=1 Tax=Protofrankia symbiont of Coriaria ruscifolia TaxID=1306542 RepID=UPI001040EF5C|nr:hypothetical protein [Protofrankia symbiont of Coriaria ruscifolia]
MAWIAGRGDPEGGRHRSPWRRSGRILPIRWGRIIALTVALSVAAGLGVWLRFRSVGSTGPQPNAAVTAVAGRAPQGGAGSDHRPTPTPTPASGAQPSAGVGAAAGAPGVAGVVVSPPQPPQSRSAVAAGETVRTSPSDTAVMAGTDLALSTGDVNLGTVNSSATMELRDTGRLPVDFRFAATPSWLSVAPASGTIAAGGRRTVTFTLDRSAAPVGVVDTSVAVVAVATLGGARQAGAVRVTAVVSGPPAIDSLTATPAVVYTTGCPSASGPTVSVVSVKATDSTGVFGAELVARLPDGRTTTSSLNLGEASGQQSVWSGPVGPSGIPGPMSFTVTVTDIDGLRAQSTGSLEVRSCPVAATGAPAGSGPG